MAQAETKVQWQTGPCAPWRAPAGRARNRREDSLGPPGFRPIGRQFTL